MTPSRLITLTKALQSGYDELMLALLLLQLPNVTDPTPKTSWVDLHLKALNECFHTHQLQLASSKHDLWEVVPRWYYHRLKQRSETTLTHRWCPDQHLLTSENQWKTPTSFVVFPLFPSHYIKIRCCLDGRGDQRLLMANGRSHVALITYRGGLK